MAKMLTNGDGKFNWIAFGSMMITILVIVFTAGNFVGNNQNVPQDLSAVRTNLALIDKQLIDEINRSKSQDEQISLQLTLNLQSIEKRISNLEATMENIYKILLEQKKKTQ